MPTASELRDLSTTRLCEAKVLFSNHLYDGACYLSGYVIEMALKACVCKILDLEFYPDIGEISKSFKTHKLDDPLQLSGLSRIHAREISNSSAFLTNWSLLTEWNEGFRYKPIGTSLEISASEMIVALEDPKDGIFTWIMKFW